MVQTIDWYKKDVDYIYNHFNKLKWEDAFLFLSELLQNYPNLPIAWIDMFADLVEKMLDEGMIEEVVRFIDLYMITFPGDYESKYEFIELELIPHLFYIEDIETLKKRIEIIKSNPVEGIDTVTKELLFKLIYHGFSDLAVEYSHAVWKPLSEAEGLFGYPENDFCNSIYLSELEKCYQRLKNGDSINIKLFKEEMNNFGFDENLDVFEEIFTRLLHPIDLNDTKPDAFRNTRDFLLFLNIQFMKFMKDEYNMPFILSDRFFNFLQKPELYGQVDKDKGFLYIPYPVLSGHYASQFDHFFNTNLVEVFGKVFGLKYVYYFFHVHNFIDDNFYKKMNENIHILENEFMVNSRDLLWQMKFFFGWPQIHAIDPYQVQIFSDTYRYNVDETVKENLNNYLKTLIIPDRIQFEKDVFNPNKKDPDSEVDTEVDTEFASEFASPSPLLPVVNDGPKIGRNDPCPCGSGKKYKKCCLDKPVNQ